MVEVEIFRGLVLNKGKRHGSKYIDKMDEKNSGRDEPCFVFPLAGEAKNESCK
jgi:hypothetical protein